MISLPHTTLQGTKCKITLLQTDVDNYIRKEHKIREMLLLLLWWHVICDDYIEHVEPELQYVLWKKVPQRKNSTVHCHHPGID